MGKINGNNKIRYNKLVLVFVFFLFCGLIVRMGMLCFGDQRVGNSTLSAFIEKRNTIEYVLYPDRGSIYDKNGNILAQTVASYTVVAYLSPTRSENSSTPLHVVDKEMTASKLAPLLNMSEESLLALLNKDAYQVELGPGGRNLSELEKEKIAELNLPGIDFVKSSKRYYANGDFASYMLGYTVNSKDNDKVLTGELGIEEYYNDVLTGSQGYIRYEKDRYGYKIANGREYVEDAKNGDDVYLTIDNNIQLFIENAVKKAGGESEADWAFMVVADAKTGAILGYSSTPSFDPNKKNMTSYLDPIVNNAYEPGSTMKIFSYMCAIDKGTYNGDDTYMSGTMSYASKTDPEDVVTISDWNKMGWGVISYDRGFALSSNIAIANILQNYINKKELKDCYEKYGFGKKTGFTLARELAGDINFKYDIEAATAGYGQGINITPIQMVQALTGISNNGDMIKPYIVDKIVDSSTGDTIYRGKRRVVNHIASENTIQKIKDLMKSVVNPDASIATGSSYYMEGYDLIGKTGTAQIFDYTTGGYKTGSTQNIYSFAGLYPYDDPDIIIYMAVKEPKDGGSYVSDAVKDVLVNTSKYLNLNVSSGENVSFEVGNYLNKNTNSIKSKLDNRGIGYVVLGNGDKIINQYPSMGSVMVKSDRVYLLTSSYDRVMIDLTGMSYKEVVNVLRLMGVKYEISGSGYVKSQSIGVGAIINDGDVVRVELGRIY